ncbi:putative bifunctional diguanylate cyclase/phosphodiesterase [Sandarakinorhabdus rubra]|uniref:putative bifunctional diguanylate cyclase/phosphodiesterase n=1 Tax=Sandarakinorhabdus rubra TaxID=2672568 RepID=UPI0013D9C548|nr:EAL domain-containing protein [Sandarakinorhabdus rubra]
MALLLVVIFTLFAQAAFAQAAPAPAASTQAPSTQGLRLDFQTVDCAAQRCPARATAAEARHWTWIEVTPTRGLARLPAGWLLLVDNTRFSAIEVQIDHGGTRTVIRRGEFELGRNWSLGNNLLFSVPVAGAEVTGIRLGYRDMDSPRLMRRVEAMDAAAHDRHMVRWIVLVALITGVLIAAIIYNMFLLTWLKTSFQNWYVVWLASALAYLLVWSGALLYLFPFLAGPASARTAYVLIGLLVLSGAAFFFALIERETLPPRLVDYGQMAGVLVALASVVAAFDMLFPASLGDRLFNIAILIVTATLLAGATFAALRGSRTVWVYLVGWAPALAMLGVRILRNFALLPQDDAVDLAGFAALGWQSLILSLAIADRFRQLRRDADSAEIERQTLRRVATTDPLTGLGNRALFQSLLDQSAMRRGGLDVIAVDIDYLKQTNDMAGHDAGDALIVAVAERLAAAAGPQGLIARVGGDEFVIVLEGQARNRLPAVRQMIALSAGVPLRHGGHDLVISICAGHASVEDRTTPLARIHKQADLALYRAKAAGRGCWRSYDASMADEASARSRLLSDARIGITAGQFRLHYQPVLRLDGRLVGHEGLLRWEHPEHGLLKPQDFPEVMKESTLLPALQHMILSEALAKAASVRARRPDLTMAVKLVSGQLQGTAAAVSILDELARHRVPPSALVVQVTETVVMSGLGGTLIECLECLRDAGVNVALDDFGTGHASLLQLRDVPANIVKIDRSFVGKLLESSSSQHIVKAIIDLAHSLGKQVVAEGVETQAQRNVLFQMGCDQAQGLLFGDANAEPPISSIAA